jgi:GTP pyrophosphokinase
MKTPRSLALGRFRDRGAPTIRRFEDILERVRDFNPELDIDLLRRAYVFSAHAHRDQVRRSGEPYLIHPLEVAYILADLHLDASSIVAGLLHDVVEDTLSTIEHVAESFGRDVAHIVAGVTKISKLEFATEEQAEAENLRRMVLAMVDDIRVILVKLADRLHNMRTLEHLDPERRVRMARETREIYAPLANRLGIGKIKAELEDLAFRYLEPETCAELTRELKARRKVSDQLIQEIQSRLATVLAEQGIAAEITGRQKAIYSIYKKMQAQGIGVDQVYDYIAFRIVTATIKDCYGALGIVHSIWRPVPGRIKDYIAMPKPNMYQSLHTSVMTERGQPFEVQIRTHEMHRVAEQGIAAHWQYKEGHGLPAPEQDRVAWLRRILDWQQDLKDPREFVQLMKVDLFPEEVYTFTPKGRVLSFPRGATPLDFAYAIHTEVGHQCVGAKANGRMVPLRYVLQNGDIIEILTQAGRQPSRDWLTLAKTSRARGKIRTWLNANERERSVELGKELLDKELRKYRLSLKPFAENGSLERILGKLGYPGLDDFHAAVGYGKVAAHALLVGLVPESELTEKPEGVVARVVRRALGRGDHRIRVSGMDDVMIALAKCCNPVRGESIVGYITRGKGVSVHSAECANVAQLLYDSERRIDVDWDTADRGVDTKFEVKLLLDVEDTQGLLAKIASAVADEKTDIRDVEARTSETPDATITMTVAVADRKEMDRVIARIRRIRGVRAVGRAKG